MTLDLDAIGKRAELWNGIDEHASIGDLRALLAEIVRLRHEVREERAQLASEVANHCAVVAQRDALRTAIATHRAQKADDRCIEDDDRLYEALGDGVACDRRVGDKVAMLANCARFIERRCLPGGWPSYAELEAERDGLRESLAAVRAHDAKATAEAIRFGRDAEGLRHHAAHLQAAYDGALAALRLALALERAARLVVSTRSDLDHRPGRPPVPVEDHDPFWGALDALATLLGPGP